ncbi:MAG: AraC family transcriptional regulator [Clostridiales bacterium]|nr:AraC family transcriptional regulator [Clostridiales bacterium]
MVYNLDSAVRVSMFGHVSQKSGRWHNGFTPSINIVIYCTDGEINMKVDNDIYHLKEGDLLLIPAKSRYQPLVGGACKYYFAHFSAEILDDADAPKHLIISPHANLTDGFAYTNESEYKSVTKVQLCIKSAPYYIKNIFEHAKNLKPNASFSDQLLLDLLFRELLIRMGEDIFKHKNNHLTKIINYIENHYADNLSLSALATHFSLSQSYIARIFRKELYCKPSEYVNKIRISVAKTLLAQTNLSVSEIAEKVGFLDVYYFSKVFKKIIGTSPIKYRL